MGRNAMQNLGMSGVREAQASHVKSPQSCSSEQAKIANISALIKSTEASLLEAEKAASREEALATGEMVLTFIMETSIAFLDLAASAFSERNEGASKVAAAGVVAIKSAHIYSKHNAGQISDKAAVAQLADLSVQHALTSANPDSLGGKVALKKAKDAYDTAVLGIKSELGQTDAEAKSEGAQYLLDRATTTGAIIGEALEANGTKSGGALVKALSSVGDMYGAAMRYDQALESMFDRRIDAKVRNMNALNERRVKIQQILTPLRTKVRVAVREWESCVQNRYSLEALI